MKRVLIYSYMRGTERANKISFTLNLERQRRLDPPRIDGGDMDTYYCVNIMDNDRQYGVRITE